MTATAPTDLRSMPDPNGHRARVHAYRPPGASRIVWAVCVLGLLAGSTSLTIVALVTTLSH